jgi:hypothetical protein
MATASASGTDTPVTNLVAPAAAAVATATSAALPASAPVTPPAPDPQVGQPESAVLAAFGQPQGRIEAPDKTILIYPRGQVMLSEGVVIETHLMDAATYAADLARQAAANAANAAASAHLNALLDALLTDPAYLALSTRDRLLALVRFERDHPGADIQADYDALLKIYATEQAAQAQANAQVNAAAIAQSQTPLAAAQAQATTAQAQAATDQAAAANAPTSATPPPTSYVYVPTYYPYYPSTYNYGYGGGYSNSNGQRPTTVSVVPTNPNAVNIYQNPPGASSILILTNGYNPLGGTKPVTTTPASGGAPPAKPKAPPSNVSTPAKPDSANLKPYAATVAAPPPASAFGAVPVNSPANNNSNNARNQQLTLTPYQEALLSRTLAGMR